MGFFHTWIVIYQNFRNNTRWVTEVTKVVIELLTQEADWLPVTRVTAVTPVTSCFFYGENAFNNIKILLNSYI